MKSNKNELSEFKDRISSIRKDVKQKVKQEVKLNYKELRKAALVLRAVNHKLRQQIIELLEQQGKMTVTDLYTKLRLEQSVCSQHLKVLRDANIVITQREGKFIYYCVNTERIPVVNGAVAILVG